MYYLKLFLGDDIESSLEAESNDYAKIHNVIIAWYGSHTLEFIA